jgi:serine/threonine protein kinase
MTTPPTAEDIDAYRRGSLPLERFEAVDKWLAQLSDDEQTRLLAEPSNTPTVAAAHFAPPPSDAVFTQETHGPHRYSIERRLGSGGMGVVELAHDHVLGRQVALKRCRARRLDESVASYAARLHTFRREAAITAQLEHPSIVPVHDVGIAMHGEPAFIMKLLEGESLAAILSQPQARKKLTVARISEIMLRIAEAIAYAHQRGVVHRDLKPENIIVGAFGAVHVIDWGLAGMMSEIASETPSETTANKSALPSVNKISSTALFPHAQKEKNHPNPDVTHGTYHLGTPAWMAPEQAHAALPHPRMDVFALGGILCALLTGHGPRLYGSMTVDLSALYERTIPRGLAAVARRCLAINPHERYEHGSAVAEELRSWINAGITQAEKPGALAMSLSFLRRSPRLTAATIGVILAAGSAGGLWWWWNTRALTELRNAMTTLSDTLDLTDENALHQARTRVDYALSQYPDEPHLLAINSRLHAAEEIFRAQQQFERDRSLLLAMQQHYRVRGPWETEIADLHRVLAEVGYPLDHAINPLTYSERLRKDRRGEHVLAILTQLHYAYSKENTPTPLRETIPALIKSAGTRPAWQAMGEVLAQISTFEHELVFCTCPASSVVLTDPITTDLILAGYGPEPRLANAAWERWHEDSAAFWPRIITARHCLRRGEWRLAERHALVALGSEPDSLWPHLILAYVALADQDYEALLHEANAGRVENHDHLELVVLAAIAHARLGRVQQAQIIIDQRDCAATLRYHLKSTSGHPLNLAARQLLDSGVTLPDIPAQLGPLVRRPGNP